MNSKNSDNRSIIKRWKRAFKFVSKFLKDLKFAQTRESFLSFVYTQIQTDEYFKVWFSPVEKSASSSKNTTDAAKSTNSSNFLHASSLFNSASSSINCSNNMTNSRVIFSVLKNSSFYKSNSSLASFYLPRQKKLSKEHLKSDIEFYHETLLLNFLWKIPATSLRNLSKKHVCLKSNTIHQKIKTIISIYFQSSPDTDLTAGYSSNLSPTLVRQICRKFSLINKKHVNLDLLFIFDCACDKDHLALFMLFQEARSQLANVFLPMYWLFTSERISSFSYSDFSFVIDKEEETSSSLFRDKKQKLSKKTSKKSLLFNEITGLKRNEYDITQLNIKISGSRILTDKCSNPRILVNASQVVYEYPLRSKKLSILK
jgi:hypothetical protein